MNVKKFIQEFSFSSILNNYEKPTFHHYNGNESIIDHIYYFSVNSEASLKHHLCKNENPENLSTHDVIIGQILLPNMKNKKVESNYSQTYSGLRVKRPDWKNGNMEAYQNDILKVLQDIFDQRDDHQNIPLLTELCSNAFVTIAENHFTTSE